MFATGDSEVSSTASTARNGTSGSGVVSAVSPRDFLDFVRHFCALFAERRAAVEARESHLRVGLLRLSGTEAAVTKLRGTLAISQVWS